MNITIVNGNSHPHQTTFETYLSTLAAQLTAEGHTVTPYTLREMDIRYCVGCFGCWVKTPGECVARDASREVCRTLINSDFALWAAPLRLGFPDAMLKKMLDKSIPLLHPYFLIDDGEVRHRPRYDHYPRVGLLLEKEADTDAEDLRIVGEILTRTAKGLKSRMEFVLTTEQPVTDVVHAITNGGGSVPFTPQLAPIPGVRVTPPGRLTVFNGSPRGAKGNTPLLLEHVMQGFTAAGNRTAEMFHLVRQNELESYREMFAAAEAVLVGFPLYTDAMPGIVKAFIEALEPLRGRAGNPPLGFLVQSGFPESLHLRYVERYLAKLATRLGCPYLGTIVKGGCESVRLMPEILNRKLFAQLFELGKQLGETGQFDMARLQKLARPERYPGYMKPAIEGMLLFFSVYWSNQLKENGVYEQRSARPYQD
ncbi:MAG TPA: NAD(P)H-dependent oxidoreductase [Anaerolineae bacterium]|nr:NAD(P)H-dependent oxidoreductase [Anaerolineae bacterium]HQK12459.1 NAD(P)H-dependent oxidoreductase [Anaerolineae bacterium]